MKHLLKTSILLVSLFLASCAGVDSGHQGVEVSWGGETNMSQVYNEGLDVGFHWMWDDMINYDARQKTLTLKSELLDADGLSIPIEAVLNFNILPSSANKLHKEIGPDYIESKISPIFKSALKTIIPQYKALQLNASKRDEAEKKLADILEKELPQIYIQYQRVNITDVDIPRQISEQIVLKQIQDEKNLLAEKKKLEETNLAAAKLEKAKGDFNAAEYDSRTKALLSQPKMLELYKAETERLWATKGVSPYGNNNVFGAGVNVLKNLQ